MATSTPMSRRLKGRIQGSKMEPQDCVLTMNTQTFWDDMRFPAAAANPPGLASDPDFDTTNGGWLFAAAGTELLFFAAQIPHSWYEGSTLVPHVHWQKTTSASGDVVWSFEYKWAPLGEAMDAAFTQVTASSTVADTPDNDTANEHMITSFGDLSGEGKQISDMLIMKLSRLGDNGSDTYGADARLLEFDIHYQIDGIGSAQQYTKISHESKI